MIVLEGKSLIACALRASAWLDVDGGFAFQACSFNHSDISPCLANQQFTG